MKKLIPLLLALIILSGCSGAKPADAPSPLETPAETSTPEPTPTPAPTPEPTPEPLAEELTSHLTAGLMGGKACATVLDKALNAYLSTEDGIWISSDEPVSSLYLVWYTAPGEYALGFDCAQMTCGENSFLREYIKLPEPAKEIELSGTAMQLSDIRAFSAGSAPDDLQIWEPPLEKADILVFPTHSDDDALFFGALMADAVNRGLKVQVAFFVDHSIGKYHTPMREHEKLDGLWAVGIRNYPTCAGFLDVVGYRYEASALQIGEDAAVSWQVATIRRFKPLVVFGHDMEGEYGHGEHKFNALNLVRSVQDAADDNLWPESERLYGAWETPKFYSHLYAENQIVLDVNEPLEAFDGKTAFEMAQLSFTYYSSQKKGEHHVRQEGYPRYDCRLFGLVDSHVGADTGNDYMEHLI